MKARELLGASEVGDQLLTVRHVAAAFAISVRLVWKLAAAGNIPRPIRIGGATRWKASDIRAHLDAASPRGSGGSQ